jgi:hypothetical protein
MMYVFLDYVCVVYVYVYDTYKKENTQGVCSWQGGAHEHTFCGLFNLWIFGCCLYSN